MIPIKPIPEMKQKPVSIILYYLNIVPIEISGLYFFFKEQRKQIIGGCYESKKGTNGYF